MSLNQRKTGVELRNASSLIKQGAEAKVYLNRTEEKPMILKYRFPKTYRHPTLDKTLNKQRIQSEIKALDRADTAGVSVPKVLFADSRDSMLGLELIDGYSVREWLGSKGEGDITASDDGVKLDMTAIGLDRREGSIIQAQTLMKLVGEQIGKLHLSGIIHGDLTKRELIIYSTSNLILKHSTKEVYIIDFGLSSLKPINHYTSAEDRAVDIYVLERAFGSTHPSLNKEYSQLLESYADTLKSSEWNKVNSKLNDVRLRGRKKDMVG
ncbi:kinase-like protein [Wallemia mellicola]|uniref:non-specific serine/threonine protein kinase n=1 Tax=Wallemia mellicola TaxID=1708541 RepID=A0A4T0N6Y8_9BASI|nr:hypothetical protein E3Q24_00387 [Wallemia mellicola]TIB89494.1 kinase-like protein [Wallemia mellicola]TIB91837.1 kinase-like protein [Wallemia mellicola]TIC03745.1 kinase-like protein [Wallemia mellicola]TIC05049.1 kinase-like protein [Wallemia mellicola]